MRWPRVRGPCSGHSAGDRGRPHLTVFLASSGTFSINVSGRWIELATRRSRFTEDARGRNGGPAASVLATLSPVLFPSAKRGPTGLQSEYLRHGETTCLSSEERQVVRKKLAEEFCTTQTPHGKLSSFRMASRI